jgi:hypothetical protein
MHDLGRNVPLASFVEKAKEVSRLICLSTLMTTTMDGMSAVIEMLKEENPGSFQGDDRRRPHSRRVLRTESAPTAMRITPPAR